MVKIFAYNFKKVLHKNDFKFIMGVLSESEKRRIDSFKRKDDQVRNMLGRYLLRKILSKYLDIFPEKIELTSNDYGKPIFSNDKFNNINFNVSYSGDWIVVVVSEHGKIGVDIEKIRPVNITISENCFAKEEILYLYNQKVRKLKTFYKIWTLKESFVKAIGEGLFCSLKSFYFEFDRSGRIKIRIKNKVKDNDTWYFKMYNIDKSYKMALCQNKNSFPKKINIINNFVI